MDILNNIDIMNILTFAPLPVQYIVTVNCKIRNRLRKYLNIKISLTMDKDHLLRNFKF